MVSGSGATMATAIVIIVITSAIGILALAKAVSHTTVFTTVTEHAARTLEARGGITPELSAAPRALMIGKTRAFVQVGARWGTGDELLDFHLERDAEGGWQVASVQPATEPRFVKYVLAAPDDELPPVTGGER